MQPALKEYALHYGGVSLSDRATSGGQSSTPAPNPGGDTDAPAEEPDVTPGPVSKKPRIDGSGPSSCMPDLSCTKTMGDDELRDALIRQLQGVCGSIGALSDVNWSKDVAAQSREMGKPPPSVARDKLEKWQENRYRRLYVPQEQQQQRAREKQSIVMQMRFVDAAKDTEAIWQPIFHALLDLQERKGMAAVREVAEFRAEVKPRPTYLSYPPDDPREREFQAAMYLLEPLCSDSETRDGDKSVDMLTLVIRQLRRLAHPLEYALCITLGYHELRGHVWEDALRVDPQHKHVRDLIGWVPDALRVLGLFMQASTTARKQAANSLFSQGSLEFVRSDSLFRLLARGATPTLLGEDQQKVARSLFESMLSLVVQFNFERHDLLDENVFVCLYRRSDESSQKDRFDLTNDTLGVSIDALQAFESRLANPDYASLDWVVVPRLLYAWNTGDEKVTEKAHQILAKMYESDRRTLEVRYVIDCEHDCNLCQGFLKGKRIEGAIQLYRNRPGAPALISQLEQKASVAPLLLSASWTHFKWTQSKDGEYQGYLHDGFVKPLVDWLLVQSKLYGNQWVSDPKSCFYRITLLLHLIYELRRDALVKELLERPWKDQVELLLSLLRPEIWCETRYTDSLPLLGWMVKGGLKLAALRMIGKDDVRFWSKMRRRQSSEEGGNFAARWKERWGSSPPWSEICQAIVNARKDLADSITGAYDHSHGRFTVRSPARLAQIAVDYGLVGEFEDVLKELAGAVREYVPSDPAERKLYQARAAAVERDLKNDYGSAFRVRCSPMRDPSASPHSSIVACMCRAISKRS